MGRRGPRPQPAVVSWMKHGGAKPQFDLDAIIEGRESTAQARVRVPRPPAALSADGRRLWAKLYRELTDAGLLATSDQQALELLVVSIDIWRQAAQAVRDDGVILKDGRGQARKHPALQVMRDQAGTVRSLLQEFAMTPKSAKFLDMEITDGD